LSAKSPFRRESESETYKAIKKGEYTFPSHDWESISEEAKDFIRQLLVKDARQRPSAVELRKHPWIKDALKNDRGATKKSGGFFTKIFRGKK
jgi:serine/threonine protein kinase